MWSWVSPDLSSPPPKQVKFLIYHMTPNLISIITAEKDRQKKSNAIEEKLIDYKKGKEKEWKEQEKALATEFKKAWEGQTLAVAEDIKKREKIAVATFKKGVEDHLKAVEAKKEVTAKRIKEEVRGRLRLMKFAQITDRLTTLSSRRRLNSTIRPSRRATSTCTGGR